MEATEREGVGTMREWTKVREGAYRYQGSAYLAVRNEAHGYWQVYKNDELVANGTLIAETRRLAGSLIANLIREDVAANTTECEQCGCGGLTYPAWQGVPDHPICASCALSTTTEA